jgi:addiction module HigA family antidote
MSVKVLEPAPISPGEVLRDDILAGSGITQDALANAMGVSRFSVNQIVNDRRAVTADMALRLSRVLRTTPDFWLNLQRDVDLYRARRRAGDAINHLPILRPEKRDSERFTTLEMLTQDA